MITCPNCWQEFEMSDALTGRLREHLKEELLQDVKRREARIKEKTEALKAQEAQVANGIKAREAAAEVLRIKPTFSMAMLEKGAVSKNKEIKERIYEPFRKAGIPEHSSRKVSD